MNNYTHTTIRIYLFLLAFGLLLMFSAEALFSNHYPFPFEEDSATYIEMARNLRLGEGLKETPPVDAFNQDMVDVSVWPPGYSVLIWALASTGLSEADAARLIAKTSLVLLPGALFFALLPLLGRRLAIVVAVLSVLSPVVLRFGYIGMSDLPFLLMAALSLGLLFRYNAPGRALQGLFWSGIVAGLAYTLRNAGTALFAAVIASFFAAWVTGILNRRQALTRGGIWVVGALVGVVALFVKNLMVFGSLQPYAWPASELGFLFNLRQYLGLQLRDIGGFHILAEFPWHTIPFLLASGLVTGLLAWALVRAWPAWSPRQRFALLTLLLYFGAGSAMMILSATLYKFSDVGLSPRYPIQYTWLLLAIVAAAWVTGRQRGRTYFVTLTLVLSVLMAGRVVYLQDEITKARQASLAFRGLVDMTHGLSAAAQTQIKAQRWTLNERLKKVVADDVSLNAVLQDLPRDAYLIGYPGYVIRIKTAQAVRSLYGIQTLSEVWTTTSKVRQHVDPGRPLYLIFYPPPSVFLLPDWQDKMLATMPSNFNLVERTANRMIFEGRAH
jgi:4-amino-4-deoxy-L-arabinose transferase-like glycosyltransferase